MTDDEKPDTKPEAPAEKPAEPKPKQPAKPALPRGRQPDAWDLLGVWIAKHGALPALGVITIAVLCFHWHIFSGESAGDDLSFHFAESARIADCIRHLDFDWWNPSANGGFASAYYYQVIPQLASALPAAIFGHHLFFFQLQHRAAARARTGGGVSRHAPDGRDAVASQRRRVLRRVHERRVALGIRQRRHVQRRPLHADLGAVRVPARARPRRALVVGEERPRAGDRMGRARVPVPSVRGHLARVRARARLPDAIRDRVAAVAVADDARRARALPRRLTARRRRVARGDSERTGSRQCAGTRGLRRRARRRRLRVDLALPCA